MKKIVISLLIATNLWSFEQNTELLNPDEFWRWGVLATVLSTYGTNIMGTSESSFEYGQTERGTSGEIVDVFKLIFQWDKDVFYQGDRLKIDWYWMLDVGRFEQRDVHVGDGANDTLGITPVFRYAYEFSWIKPYVEVGMGLYWIAYTEYIGRNLTSNFQFGDFITFGAYVGNRKQWHIAYKFFHHSNAETSHPNEGIGMELFSIGYRY